MTQFLRAGDFAYHITGGYTPRTEQFIVSITSTFDAARDSTYHRQLINLNVKEAELDLIIAELISIKAQKTGVSETSLEIP